MKGCVCVGKDMGEKKDFLFPPYYPYGGMGGVWLLGWTVFRRYFLLCGHLAKISFL